MLTIFCGGVHGVGKTTFCRHLAADIHAAHISVGDILRAAGLAQRREHAVSSVARNQRYVLNALRHWQEESVVDRVLIDGHFCLLTAMNRIVPVPTSVFSALRPHALLAITDDPDDIAERIAARGDRRVGRSLIGELQEQELQQAEYVSRTLNVPLRVTMVGESRSIIGSWLSRLATSTTGSV